MTDRRTAQVTTDTAGRLDRFVADQFSLSRTQAARLIGEDAVTINGAPARAGSRLRRGDRVEITFPPEDPPRTIRPYPIDLTVVHEDESILVLDKPAGLVVHPAPGHWDDTLVNALVARGTALAKAAPQRPGIVHRLDRDTSGLMVVAKTDQAHRRLGRDLAARRIQRTYAALVWGHPEDQVIDAPIARHPADRKRMMVIATGRPAVSAVRSVARFGVGDLIAVALETGRTHQIRVHLAHIGHPVVGDPVYGGGGARRLAGQQRGAGRAVERVTPRQALHAAALRLRHPESGEWLEFKAEWPDDLKECLAVVANDDGLLARDSALDYFGLFARHG